MANLNYQERKKRWEQQRREEQRQQNKERQRLEKNNINNLSAEIICEIFDKDPKLGLMLANTNKWMSEVLKDKIKKHRHLIQECNVAAFCYEQTLCNIRHKTWEEFKCCFDFECYFYCVNCFDSTIITLFMPCFYIKNSEEIRKNGMLLCHDCSFKFYGEKLNEIARKLEEFDEMYDDEDEDGFRIPKEYF